MMARSNPYGRRRLFFNGIRCPLQFAPALSFTYCASTICPVPVFSYTLSASFSKRVHQMHNRYAYVGVFKGVDHVYFELYIVYGAVLASGITNTTSLLIVLPFCCRNRDAAVAIWQWRAPDQIGRSRSTFAYVAASDPAPRGRKPLGNGGAFESSGVFLTTAESFQHQETLSSNAQTRVMMKASAVATFIVSEREFLFELLVAALNAPASHRRVDYRLLT